MASHINLTSLEGKMIVVDKNRIASVSASDLIHEYNFEEALVRWKERSNTASLDEIMSNISVLKRPERESYRVKITIVTLSNKRSIKVSESVEEVYEKITKK